MITELIPTLLLIAIGAVCLLKGKRRWGIAIVAVPAAFVALLWLPVISERELAQLAGIMGLALIATIAAAVSAAIERANQGSWWARNVREVPPISSLPPSEARRHRFVIAKRRFNYGVGGFTLLMWIPALGCQGVECDVWIAFTPMLIFVLFVLLVGNVVANRVHKARMARVERAAPSPNLPEPPRQVVS